MTEDLPLPPEVRAVRADALRPLDSHWTCDYCSDPAVFGVRRSCCRTAVVFCVRHVQEQQSEIAGALVAGYAATCPSCGCLFHPPVRPAHLFEHHWNLMTGGHE